jgi:hypothetical protein
MISNSCALRTDHYDTEAHLSHLCPHVSSNMASGRVAARRVPDNESSIAYVQMDGLVNAVKSTSN